MTATKSCGIQSGFGLNPLHACRSAQRFTPTEVELNDLSSSKEGEEEDQDNSEYPTVSITEEESNKDSAEYPIVSITEDGMQMTVRK